MITFNNINSYNNYNLCSFGKKKKDTVNRDGFFKSEKDMEKYSKKQILELFEGDVFCKDSEQKNTAKILYNKLAKGDVQSSNYEMLMQLVKDGKISYRCIMKIPPNSKVSDNVAKDLDKLYKCYAESLNISDEFVPEFKSEKMAKNNLQIGDVCVINGEKNIRIKMKDNSLKELYLSKENYMKLFPPVERFIYSQGKLGHCFLLASINSIYSNPNLRYKILEMFKEEDDGSLTMVLGGFGKTKDSKIEPVFDLEYVHHIPKEGVDNKGSFYSLSCEGVKFIEQYYQYRKIKKADDAIQEEYEKFSNALKNYDNNNDYILIDDMKYTKAEIENILQCIDYYRKNPKNKSKKPIYLNDVGFLYSKKNKHKKDNEIDKETNRILKAMDKRYQDYFKRSGKDEIMAKDILPYHIVAFLMGIKDKTPFEDIYYINGGNAYEVFSDFNLDENYLEISDDIDEIKKIMADDKTLENTVFCVAKYGEYDKKNNIEEYHSYSLQPVKINGEQMFLLRNPYNTSQERILTLKNVMKYFDSVEIGVEED